MERTFAEDVSDREELRVFLLEFCEEVAFGLREKGLRGKTVTLKARYSDFKTVTRSQTLAASTNSGARIYSVARELLGRVPAGSLRLIGVQLSQLEDVREPVQADLFAGLEESGSLNRRNHDAVTEGLDKLRRKYGRGAVLRGSLVGRARARGLDGTETT
jgi:DNA polymerase-4